MRHISARSIRERSLVLASRLFSSDKASCELTRFSCSRDGRFALVHRRAQFRIIPSRLHVLRLRLDRPHVLLFGKSLLLRGGTRFHPAPTSVEANVTFRRVAHRSVKRIVDDRSAYAIHGSVVQEAVPFPPPPLIPKPAVTVTVINPAVVAHRRAPISLIKIVRVPAPAPITRRPQKARLRRVDPSARRPVVLISRVVVAPVTGCPQVAVARKDRLLVDRKQRRPEPHRNPNLRKCPMRKSQQHKRKQHRANNNPSTHRAPPPACSPRLNACPSPVAASSRSVAAVHEFERRALFAIERGPLCNRRMFFAINVAGQLH